MDISSMSFLSSSGDHGPLLDCGLSYRAPLGEPGDAEPLPLLLLNAGGDDDNGVTWTGVTCSCIIWACTGIGTVWSEP